MMRSPLHLGSCVLLVSAVVCACGGSGDDMGADGVGDDEGMESENEDANGSTAGGGAGASSDDGSDSAGDSVDTGTNCGIVVEDGSGPGRFMDDYESSEAFFTRIDTALPSRIHADQRTWYSTNLEEFAPEGPFNAPPGSVAIKAEYDASGTNFVTVVMVKHEPGYDPENGAWCYEARQPDGSIASDPVPGPAALCIGCHTGAEDTDYLLGFALEN